MPAEISTSTAATAATARDASEAAMDGGNAAGPGDQ